MLSSSENKSKSKRPNRTLDRFFRKVSVSSTNEAEQSKPKELSIESEASTSSAKSLISTPQNLPPYPDIAKLNDLKFHEKGIKMKILTCRLENSHTFNFPIR